MVGERHGTAVARESWDDDGVRELARCRPAVCQATRSGKAGGYLSVVLPRGGSVFRNYLALYDLVDLSGDATPLGKETGRRSDFPPRAPHTTSF